MRGVKRILATLATVVAVTGIGVVGLAGPAVANRPAPGIAGAYYPNYYYQGVRMDLSRPYVWLDNGNLWTYASKTDYQFTHQLRLYNGVLDVRNYKTGEVHVIAGWNGSGATQLVLQPDSNLVLYRDNGSVVWATNHFCNNATGQGSVLALQDDANIVVYCTANWSSHDPVSVNWALGFWVM